MFQGIAEKASGGNNPLIGERFRFIGNQAATARGEMVLYDEAKGIEVKVMRKLTKTGTDLSFVGPDGMILDQKWLTDLFNIFLIAPKKFQELSPKDQARAIGIDTTKFDTELADLKKKYTEINAVYRSFGEIAPVEKIEKVDVSALLTKKTDTQAERIGKRKLISDALNETYKKNVQSNKDAKEAWENAKRGIDTEVAGHNEAEVKKIQSYNAVQNAAAILQNHGYTGSEVLVWMDTLKAAMLPAKEASKLYPVEPTYPEPKPDDAELVNFDQETTQVISAIDLEIQNTNETNQKAVLYTQYLELVEKKAAKKTELDNNTILQSAKETDRLNYIKAFNLPFGNMSIGDDGELLLSGKPIKEPYFSTGELLKIIPILISTRNPEFKYVFLQDFNLLDDDKQEEVSTYLTGKGFQLVVEYVSKEPVIGKNCILLKDNVIVESFDVEQKATLEV